MQPSSASYLIVMRVANWEVAMMEYQRLQLTELITQYVRTRSKLGAVSISAASDAVRRFMPNCPEGPEVEKLIADIALDNGHSLLLDGDCLDCWDALKKPSRPVSRH
jgi:hypothetical protein